MAKVAQQAAARHEGRSLELIANIAGIFWGEVAERISGLEKQLVEEFLEARRTEALGAESYERADGRNGYRGGSYRRSLKTRW